MAETKEYRDIATTAAAEYQRHVNIRFDFTSNQGQSDVRISFDPAKGFWSFVGTQALQIPLNKVTMNLAFTNRMLYEDMMGKARHEFGHVVGLVHEHQHPAGPKFNAGRAREHFSSRGIPSDQLDNQVLNPHTALRYLTRDYDPESIMHYEVPEHITRDGTTVGRNTRLSRGDIATLQALYPNRRRRVRRVQDDGRFYTSPMSRNVDQLTAAALSRQYDGMTIQDNNGLSSPWSYANSGVSQ